MRRKVIRHGGSTLTISLPQKWARKNGVEKGDELIVKEEGKRLVVEIENSGNDVKRKEIYIESYERLGLGYILGLYRNGFDEITMHYSEPDYIEVIHETLNSKIKGFEIIRQGKDSCTIKDLLGIEKGDFDLALRRLWVLLLSISEDLLEAVEKDDVATIQNIPKRDKSINAFTNYCVRIIMKKGLRDHRRNCASYFLVTVLEEISDQYKEISIYFADHDRKMSSEVKEIFSQVNLYLRELYELNYKFDKAKAEELFTGTLVTPKQIRNLLSKINDNGSTLGNLLNICEEIRSLLSIIIELNIQ